MEFEIEEKFVEHDQRSIHSRLSTSTEFVDFKNELVEDKSAMELQLKIEEEFVDHKEMKNEPEEEYGSAIEVKVEPKEEFAGDVEGCIEPHLITSLDLKNLNNEQCEDNLAMELQFKIEEESVDYKEMKNEPEDEDGSAMEVKVETKEEFARDVEGCIEPHLIMSLDLKNLNNEQCEDNLGLSHKNRMEIMKILPEDSFNKNQISPDYEEVPINNLNGHVNMKTEEGPEKNKCLSYKKNRMEIMKISPEDSFNKNQISPDSEEVPINNLNVTIQTGEGPEKNKCEICFKQSEGPKSKKRKLTDDDSLENQYEAQLDEGESDKQVKNLLPIKTKRGIIPMQTLEPIQDEQDEEASDVNNEEEVIEETEPEGNNFSLESTGFDTGEPISAAQLLAKRNEVINKMKIHIGTLSSGLLENPEEKVLNLRTLLSLMDEEAAQLYITVKKLITVSLLEVFKDILPSYEIKNLMPDGVKLKKDTLKLQKYEENLLLYYKKFLQKLEKYALVLFKKRGDTRKRSEEELTLGVLAIQAMCELLITHPYFNFSQNIAQAVVPFLNNRDKSVRELVKTSVKTVFKEDKKDEITLKILRIINNYLKNHLHVHVDMLEVFLVLNLRDVNLDQEKEQDMKQKKLMSHKSRLLQMSKKERKRKKKLKEVEKELMETKAEENKQVKQKNLTEITKIIFNVYFRILKTSSDTKILGVCLEGLAKYAHCINLEYYVDIVNVLDNLLKEDWLGYREQLHCIQTAFAILGGQGEALNLDPLRFYNNLYKELLTINASSKKSDSTLILIKTLNEALVRRRKKITSKRMLGFTKRLAQLSLQLTHDGSMGCLSLIKTIMQLSRSTDILLDLDPSTGEGKYDPEIDDPEYSNASSSALYELMLLSKHYHPIVSKFGRNIASGAPSAGEGSLPGEYAKSAADQLYIDFDMSEMAFNPPVPPPKKEQPKTRPKQIFFADSTFEEECRQCLRRPTKRKSFWFDSL
ncbi:nucleolar complex protein 3 homolog isoform X3 [Diabrotica virgifera virgifera]|uniref:NOC3-like protein n=1 Tax=Diabrotica virgifera virgifera TaxID=50390 RepID=A0ABM5KKS1_DIAVI|nr:nucleolar complex protein 3 homolog isoform X3 [Diabrotica virgifera virgifera]